MRIWYDSALFILNPLYINTLKFYQTCSVPYKDYKYFPLIQSSDPKFWDWEFSVWDYAIKDIVSFH